MGQKRERIKDKEERVKRAKRGRGNVKKRRRRGLEREGWEEGKRREKERYEREGERGKKERKQIHSSMPLFLMCQSQNAVDCKCLSD